MSARAAYPNAQIFAHPAMSGAQLEQVCKDNGLEYTREPTGNFSLEQKREKAIAYLRSRGKYVLDMGSKKPSWGNGTPPDAA